MSIHLEKDNLQIVLGQNLATLFADNPRNLLLHQAHLSRESLAVAAASDTHQLVVQHREYL